MTDQPYSQFPPEDLTLRDGLAIDRTALANERTLLAYVRTALALIILGATLIDFFDLMLYQVVGAISFVLGLGTLVLGGVRFLQVRRRLAKTQAALRAE
jgi:putative membrane protein